jgi:hypothetical protein
MWVPRSRLLQPRWWVAWASQFCVLTAVATAVWMVLLQPVFARLPHLLP